EGKVVLQHVAVDNLSIGMEVSVVARDQSGKVIPNKPTPATPWSKPLRYYRLAQLATDLYEAYRNMFLGFESLLHILCPRQQESERQWLRRALYAAGELIDLRKFCPEGTTDPAAYLYETQYVNVRC